MQRLGHSFAPLVYAVALILLTTIAIPFGGIAPGLEQGIFAAFAFGIALCALGVQIGFLGTNGRLTRAPLASRFRAHFSRTSEYRFFSRRDFLRT